MKIIKLMDKETYESHQYSVSDELYKKVKDLTEKESLEHEEKEEM